MSETDHAPENWPRCSLADIVVINPKNDASAEQRAGFVPMALAPTDYHGALHYEEKLWGEIKKSYTNFADGDVIFAKVTPCFENGKAAIVRDMPAGIGAGSSEFYVLRPASKEISSSLLFAIIKTQSFMQQGAENMTGAVGLRRVPRAFVEAFPLALPPFAEQKVIADKLDILLSQVENTKARLERIPQILKRFRQSVLAAAVSGRLTEAWRETNKYQAAWESMPFADLLLQLRSGAGDKPNDDPEGTPILRSSAVRSMEIDFSDIRYLAKAEQLKKDNFLKPGDLLFTRLSGSAEYVGNCAMVRSIDRHYQFPDRLFCARLKEPRQARFLEYFCASQNFREHVQGSLKSSAGHQRITLDVIKNAVVEMPSLEEQTEIVHRIDQLFAHADRIEQQVNNALSRVNNLTQSILVKAFRGELTEQWRKDNPELISGENSAEALLERIKAERAAMNPVKRTRKKRTTV